MEALQALEAISRARGTRMWLNPRTLQSWNTDAQIRKTAWQPIMLQAGIKYGNPYQIRPTYASSMLTAGANPLVSRRATQARMASSSARTTKSPCQPCAS